MTITFDPKARGEYQREREAHPKPMEFSILTKVPSKWRLVDLETGSVYRLSEEQGKLVSRGSGEGR